MVGYPDSPLTPVDVRSVADVQPGYKLIWVLHHIPDAPFVSRHGFCPLLIRCVIFIVVPF